MNIILIAFVVGVSSFHLLPVLPDQRWLLSALIILGLWTYPRLRPVAALLGGFLWSFTFASFQLNPIFPQDLEGKDLILTGVVSSIPTGVTSMTRFEMSVVMIESERAITHYANKLRLSWRRQQSDLEPGQLWRLKVRLKRPWGFQNPGGFDYERWLYSRGIDATGYVRRWDGNEKLSEEYHGEWLDRVRQRLGKQIDSKITETRTAALIKALAIGDRSGMSSADWEMFSRTGTNHLVAISGLHIGMVAGLVFFLTQWLWRRSSALLLLLPAARAGAWSALFAASVYAALAGFTLPTQRALVMLTLGLGAVLTGRSLSVSRSLSLALFGVVLIDPLAPLSAGFWLSFGAVAVILFSLRGRLALSSAWHRWGKVQWVVALGLAPLLLFLFGRASVVAPLVNLILVPWFSLVLIPIVLLALPMQHLPVLGDAWMRLTEVLAGFTLQILEGASKMPYATIQLPDLPVWVWISGMAGALLLLLPRGLPGRPLGVLLIIPMLLNSPPKQDEGSLLLTLLDVGQGLSCVIETAEHLLIYDTGPEFPSGFNTAESVLMPYIRSRGISRVDRLILSNHDRDHAGGLEALRKHIEINRTLAGEAGKFDQVEPCQAGAAWEWDGVRFRILHPMPDEQFSRPNNASCVLKVETAGGSILISGDIERKAEALLIDRHAGDLRANILIAPHHGSKTSSSEGFVQRVNPDYVLFATGYRNRFGFPKTSVVKRWTEMGAKGFNTAETGAIQFKLNADEPISGPMLYRRDHPHYWLSSKLIHE